MKKIFLYLLILGFKPCFTSAQSNFKPGYVIIGNDTLKGFVDYRSWQENPSAISFEKDLHGQAAIKYTPAQIRAFAVTGIEYYHSYTVNISRDPVEANYLKQGKDTSYVTKTVFLRLLSAGKNISLFDYTDDIKTRYYVLDGESAQPHELPYHVFTSLQNSTQIETSYGYRNQMEYLAIKYHTNNPKLEHEIEFSQYSESELVKITKSINEDSSERFTPKSRFGLGWVVSAGINANDMDFPNLLNYPYNTAFFPRVSIGVNLFPNVNTQKIFLRGELSYTQSTHSFSQPANGFNYASSIKNIRQSTLSVVPQVIINLYNTDNLQVFVNVGMSINFSSYNNYFLSQTIDNLPTNLYYGPDLDKIWISFPIKFGVTIHRKVEFFAGYSPPVIVTPGYTQVQGHIFEYGAGLGYRFGTR